MELPEAQRDTMRAVSCQHTGYGLGECFPDREIINIVLVREPIDRFVSHYNYAISTSGAAQYNDVKDLSPRDFLGYLRTPPRNRRHRDMQCHLLCGRRYFSDAKEYVDGKYALAAPIELMDFFLDRLASMLEIPNPHFSGPKNVSKKSIGKRDLPKDLILDLYNDYTEDLQLYHYVKKKFVDEMLGK